jgi:CPA2 family monovalent cation:H+ antiporter-2
MQEQAMHELPLITTIAGAFAAAWVLGLLTQWLRLSPIVGYLLAGVVIGPYTPGFVGDVHLARQLAEIGVILLMFGVGLHFNLRDLLAVRDVAIPGAIGQSLVATLLGVGLAVVIGMPLKGGLVLGLAMAVASTVVLIRVLTDNQSLETTAGHIAVGWLIVEDLFTVVVLVLLPAMGTPAHGEAGATGNVWLSLGAALLKLGVFAAILLVGGSRVIPWIMVKVARFRSRELFTLTVLVMAIAIATGSYYLFGASMALGAFLAGVVVGQSPVSHQAAADALPLQDAFAVLFFASVGMLFDPRFVIHHPFLLLAGLAIILVSKPLTAFVIVAVLGYPVRMALTVAMGLAQIGEFSFILSDLARAHGLLGEDGHNLLVGSALVTITINPLLFRTIDPMERLLRKSPRLWRWLSRRTAAREGKINQQAKDAIDGCGDKPIAVIVGYGPVGRAVDSILRESALQPVIIDLNMETVEQLSREGRAAIYGDGSNIEIMRHALPTATHLIVTLPHSVNRNPLIVAAKLINPEIKVFVRAHYIEEQHELLQSGADGACFEEAEAAVALSRLILEDQSADAETIRSETRRIRQRFKAKTVL